MHHVASPPDPPPGTELEFKEFRSANETFSSMVVEGSCVEREAPKR